MPALTNSSAWIVIQQWRRRHDFVITLCEEIQEAAPNLGGFHGGVLSAEIENGLAGRLAFRHVERLAEFGFALGHSGSYPVNEPTADSLMPLAVPATR